MFDEQSEQAQSVSRRDFLAAAGLAVASAQSPQARASERDRHFSTSSRFEATGAGPVSPQPFELEEVPIAELQRGMVEGRWTSVDLVEPYLSRIGELDRKGPALRHVLETNPDAPAQARALDRERQSGKVRGPLHGIPVVLKDNIDTADR